MPDFYLPTEHDKRLLQWVINEVRKRVTPLGVPQLYPRLMMTSDCYIIKLPDSGIPALDDDVPGSADCNIYKINDDDSSFILEDTEITIKVFNLYPFIIKGTFARIVKDKYGRWIIDNPMIRMIRGQLNGAMHVDDSVWPINNVFVISGDDPRDNPGDTDEDVPCYNDLLGGAGVDGAEFIAIWDPTNDRWMFLQGHHQALDPITSWRVDTTTKKLQYKTTSISIMINGTESDWIDAHTGTETCP